MDETEHCRWIEAIDRLDWLTQRHRFIGASEAAAVIGVSNWSSPYGLWYRKTSPVEDREPSVEQEIGHELEPFMARKFTEVSGVETSDPGDFAIAVSKPYPWLSCTLDRYAEGMIPVELKTAKFDAAKEWKTRVPLAYQVQVHMQMIVTGARESYIVVLLNCSELKWFRVAYHDRFAERLIARTKDFYDRCLIGGERPDTDDHKSTREALSAIYPEASGETLDLPSELDPFGKEYDAICAAIAEQEKRKQAIQNRVKDALGESPFGRLSDGSGFRWSGGKTRRFTRAKKVKTDEQ